MPHIGRSFTILESVDSTNNYAMAAVHAGLAKHGNAYFTIAQTAGKGQRGRTWYANAGENITMSVIIEPDSLLSDQFLLNAAIALGCYDLFNAYAGDETAIKWPNDIYWRDRKAGGILIENVVKGDKCQYAVAGMGMNINQTRFDPALHHPVSLKQVTGKTHDVIVLARELCGYLENRFSQFQQTDKTTLLEAYNRVLFRRGAQVTLKKNNVVFETRITGVSRLGTLVTRNVVEQEFNWGEVEWVL